MICAISQFRAIAPNWTAIELLPMPQAADAVASILSALDGAEEMVFAARGKALLVIEERKLWEGRADSMGQWIRKVAPKSWRECYAAMSTIRAVLPDVGMEDLKEMKRCNIEEVKKLSSAVRRDPKVIESAKVLTRKEFLEKTAADHPNQHIGVQSKLEEAIEMCMVLEGLSRKAAEDFVGEFYIGEYAVAYEQHMSGVLNGAT